ncbi:aldehyde dehydrogenase family protein, partial [Gordonia terrae]
AYSDAVRSIFPTYLDHEGVVSLINDRNFDRVKGLIDDAAARGAKVVSIVDDAERDDLPNRERRRIAPTVLLGVTEDMEIASEEIFGPVTVVYPYDDVSDAIDYINAHPRPLAAYFFGPDDAYYRALLAKTTSGGVTRNDLALHWSIEGAPSGGIGRSGMGAYTGATGFETFSHLRTVTSSELPVSLFSAMLPPAGQAEADGIAAMIAQARQQIEDRLAAGS